MTLRIQLVVLFTLRGRSEHLRFPVDALRLKVPAAAEEPHQTHVRNVALIAGSNPVRVVDMEDRPRERARGRLGRAYRAGQLVCGCVHVIVSLDDRLGLTQQERRFVRVRFHEPLDDDVRAELGRLVRRRGAAAGRVAERIDPIEFVLDDPHGARVRIVGRVQPPQVRHGYLVHA